MKKKLSKKSYSQLDPFLGQIIKVFILNTYFRLNLIIFLWNQIESSKFCGSLNKYQPFRTQRLEYCSSKFESWAKHLYFRNSINPQIPIIISSSRNNFVKFSHFLVHLWMMLNLFWNVKLEMYAKSDIHSWNMQNLFKFLLNWVHRRNTLIEQWVFWRLNGTQLAAACSS